MAINIDIDQNLDAVRREIADFSDRQVPFAMAKALNRTAFAGKDRVTDEMKRVFDRPTKFTLNSLFVRSARKKDLAASVNIREFASKGTPAFKYLAPQIAGGQRRTKRFERALQSAGHLPRDMFAVPGNRAKLDSYGNMNRGQITKILSFLRASSDPTQNRGGGLGKRTRRRDRYFVGQFNGGNSPFGIWQIMDDHVLPIVMFVDAVSYQPRLPFAALVHSAVEDEFGRFFREELRNAHATRR